MKIIIEEIGGSFKSSLEGKPEIHHHGSNEAEAIGNLIKSRQSLFNIEIKKVVDGKKIPSTSIA